MTLQNSLSKEEELDAVRLSISTHRDLLRQVTSYPNRKLKQPDFLPYDPADSLADAAAFLPLEPCYVFPDSSSCSSSPASGPDHCLKPLQELCNPYFLSLTKEQLAAAECRLRGDGSALRTARLAAALSRRHPALNFLFELCCPDDDADEGEGEGEGAETEQQQQQQPSSFSSCVEELPIKMEAGTATSDPSAEMARSVSSSDSIEVLGTERSYCTQHLSAASDSRGTK